MNIKENDQIPNVDIFVIENEEASQKKYSSTFKR